VRTTVTVACAGALGALARYGAGGLVARANRSAFPWETFAINVTGSFALGLVFTLLAERWAAPPWLRSAATIGFLGSYTTFSTLAFESYRLVEDRAILLGMLNLAASCAAGLAAVWLGVVLGRVL
jgi:CrcB protein